MKRCWVTFRGARREQQNWNLRELCVWTARVLNHYLDGLLAQGLVSIPSTSACEWRVRERPSLRDGALTFPHSPASPPPPHLLRIFGLNVCSLQKRGISWQLLQASF